jgi:hypothetical protein
MMRELPFSIRKLTPSDATSDISDGSASDKKLNRSAHVYKPSPYSKSITDSVS